MPKAQVNGVELEYAVHGDADAPVILLIMGLGAQMTLWPPEFIAALVERGFRVVAYDNRDVGLSTKFDAAGVPNLRWLMVKALLGITSRVPYSLSDMAADGIGLLDHLGIAKAHIVGASMGGMIAQHVAAEYPERTLSLTSIMSTTGNRKLPGPTRAAAKALTNRPQTQDIDALVANSVRTAAVIGSPGYPPNEGRLRTRVRSDIERCYYPQGFGRQLAAIVVDGDRRPLLSGITAPTLVIHGEADPLIPVDCGRDTAASIPGAKLLTIPGMGHDLPLALVETMRDAITDHARAHPG